MRPAPRQRLANGLAEHEMRAHEPHRLPRGGAHRRAAEPAHQAMENALRRLVGGDDPRRNAERPGRGRHQQGRRMHRVVGEVAGRQLVLDEVVRGRVVGHPQQRLGEDHQGEPLLGRERELVEEILDAADPADPAGLGADRRDQRAGAGIDASLGLRPRRGGAEKPRGEILIGRRIGRAERRDASFHRVHLLKCETESLRRMSAHKNPRSLRSRKQYCVTSGTGLPLPLAGEGLGVGLQPLRKALPLWPATPFSRFSSQRSGRLRLPAAGGRPQYRSRSAAGRYASRSLRCPTGRLRRPCRPRGLPVLGNGVTRIPDDGRSATGSAHFSFRLTHASLSSPGRAGQRHRRGQRIREDALASANSG